MSISLENIAVIDIGSNAVRLGITQIDSQRPETTVLKWTQKLRVPLRLGSSVFSKNNKVDDHTIDFAKKVFAEFRKVSDDHNVKRLWCLATSAFREAKNSDILSYEIERVSGIKVQELSGMNEAMMVYEALTPYLEHYSLKNDVVLMDLGGGSLEINYIKKGKCENSRSFNIGAVRLMNLYKEQVDQNDGPVLDYLLRIKDEIESFIGEIGLNDNKLKIVGTGGNFRRLLKLKRNLFGENAHYTSYEELSEIRRQLESVSYNKRMKLFKLRADRADVIIPAFEIIDLALSCFSAKKLKIYSPDLGLMDGMVLKMRKTPELGQFFFSERLAELRPL